MQYQYYLEYRFHLKGPETKKLIVRLPSWVNLLGKKKKYQGCGVTLNTLLENDGVQQKFVSCQQN